MMCRTKILRYKEGNQEMVTRAVSKFSSLLSSLSRLCDKTKKEKKQEERRGECSSAISFRRRAASLQVSRGKAFQRRSLPEAKLTEEELTEAELTEAENEVVFQLPEPKFQVFSKLESKLQCFSLLAILMRKDDSGRQGWARARRNDPVGDVGKKQEPITEAY
ncbi:hypothetical protein AKJ16_DCAP00720 [Drosera capensis]